MIEELARIHGSMNAAARACGIPESSMYRLSIGDRRNPRIDTIQKLASGFPGKSFLDVVAEFSGDSGGNGPMRQPATA
jgi:predicted transcriptional regulator